MLHRRKSSPDRQSESLGSWRKNGGGDFLLALSAAATETAAVESSSKDDDKNFILKDWNLSLISCQCFSKRRATTEDLAVKGERNQGK